MTENHGDLKNDRTSAIGFFRTIGVIHPELVRFIAAVLAAVGVVFGIKSKEPEAIAQTVRMEIHRLCVQQTAAHTDALTRVFHYIELEVRKQHPNIGPFKMPELPDFNQCDDFK